TVSRTCVAPQGNAKVRHRVPDSPSAQTLLLLGPGQIDRRGNRCALRVRRDCGAKGTHQRSRVLLQGLAADVCSRVTGAMIAGIVWATGCRTDELRSRFRLLS